MAAQPDYISWDDPSVWDIIKVKIVVVSDALRHEHGRRLGPLYLVPAEPWALMGWVGMKTLIFLLDEKAKDMVDLRPLEAYRGNCQVVVADLRDVFDVRASA